MKTQSVARQRRNEFEKNEQLALEESNKRLLAIRAEQVKNAPIPTSPEKAAAIEADVFAWANAGLMRPSAAEKLVQALRRVNARGEGTPASGDWQKEKQRQDIERFLKHRVAEWITGSGIPMQFKEASFDRTERGTDLNIDERNRRVYDLCRRLAAEWHPGHKGLTISGPTGCGKSYLAIVALLAIIQSHSDTNLYSRFVTERDLMQFLRRSYGRRNDDPYTPSTGETIEYYIRRPQILVLDDLGAEDGERDWARGQILDLVEYRSVNRKTTIYTTNLSDHDIERRYGDRILSRITGQSPWVSMSGDDYRQTNNGDDDDPFAEWKNDAA